MVSSQRRSRRSDVRESRTSGEELIEGVLGAVWLGRLALSGNAIGNLSKLREWAKLDAAETSALQLDRLESLLMHASESVPYYRSLLRHYGVVSGTKVRLEHFDDLPILDKPTIRRNFDALQSGDIDRMRTRLNHSGGSTGAPVKLVQDSHYHDWKTATKLFFETRAGTRPGARSLVLWGSQRDVKGTRASWRSRLGQRLRNELLLDTFTMSPEVLRSYVDEFNRFRPETVLAYAESIYRLARFAEREGLRLHSPKRIFTSATTLFPVMRQTIERVFGAPVLDRYGSREVGVVACEQPDIEGLVVSAPTHLVEVLRADGSPAGPGESGEIVVTPLTNFAMPLLRYRIGDVATLPAGESAPGLAWPRLAGIRGRVSDSFWRADGTQVFGEYFTHLFYGCDWVDEFQVVQEEFDHITVRLQTGEKTGDDDDIRRLEQEIRAVMGDRCQIQFEFVEEIEPGPSGKHRFTMSLIDPDSVDPESAATKVTV